MHKRRDHPPPQWLEDAADDLLLQEALPLVGRADADRLHREAFHSYGESAAHGSRSCVPPRRRGAPASSAHYWFPVVKRLVASGLSQEGAWKLVRKHSEAEHERGGRAPVVQHSTASLHRMFNRARRAEDKLAHEIAAAILLGKPQAFARAYKKLARIAASPPVE